MTRPVELVFAAAFVRNPLASSTDGSGRLVLAGDPAREGLDEVPLGERAFMALVVETGLLVVAAMLPVVAAVLLVVATVLLVPLSGLLRLGVRAIRNCAAGANAWDGEEA